MLNGNKRYINVLANIDNYMGEHEGRLAPFLTFLGISAAPFLLYAFLLQGIVPLKYVLIFEVLWAARFGLLILGGENKKLAQYRRERENVYKTAENLIHVSNLSADGLLEYSNGRIAYILTGYILDYADDESMNIDLQNFLKQLRGNIYHIYSHMVVDEYRLQDDIDKLQVYEDAEFIRERMLLYQEQDEYCTANSEAFKVSIVVTGSKYEWKTLRTKLERLCGSEYSYCWHDLHICDSAGVTDVLSRDLCMDVNIPNMLVEKYKSDEFYGSKVLFYGDKIPEEYKKHKDEANVKSRRVVVK